MDFGDFDRLGLVPRLPPRAELPTALRLALVQVTLLPLELVAWVATSEPGALRTQLRQAIMVRFESKDEQEAEQAGQLARLIVKRLEQLHQPVVVQGRQLRLRPSVVQGRQLVLSLEG